MKGFFKGFFLTLFVLLILGIGVSGYFLVKTHAQNPKDFFADLGEQEDSVDFLLLGVDSLHSKEAKNTRSDVMMIVHCDTVNKTSTLLSVPRDTRTPIEGRKYQEKMNHAYAYGGEELALKTVNARLGTSIPYYMVLDYNFVKETVDTMGGVDVTVPMDMHYEDPTADPPLYIDLQAGPQRLDGNQAMQFLRFRKGYKNADLDRVQAQQQFMTAFLKGLKSPQTLLKFPLYLQSYEENTKTNLPMSKLVKMAPTVLTMDGDSMKTATLPGNPQMVKKVSYYILDDEATDALLYENGLK